METSWDLIQAAEDALMNLPDVCFPDLIKTLDTDIINAIYDAMVQTKRLPKE